MDFFLQDQVISETFRGACDMSVVSAALLIAVLRWILDSKSVGYPADARITRH
jgi:hypothetical protein